MTDRSGEAAAFATPGRADRYAAVESRLQKPMFALSVALLVLILLPVVMPHLSHGTHVVLDGFDWAIWACFTGEYVTLLTLAPDRRRFVRTHVADLVLVLVPMLRPLRLLRSVRALRALRLLRIAGATTKSVHAGRRSIGRRGATYVSGLTAVLLVACSVVTLDAERGVRGANIRTLRDALWWATTTVTTVGYGDRYPVTTTGRVVAFLLMLTGIALVGVITAAVAAWFVRVDERELGEQTDSELGALAGEIAQLRGLVEALRADLSELSPVTTLVAPQTSPDGVPSR